MYDLVPVEVFPVVLINLDIRTIHKDYDKTYTETMLKYHFKADFDIKLEKLDDHEIPLQIWSIPHAGHLLTNYNRNIEDSNIQLLLNFFDKVKIFIIGIDGQNPEYEFLERILAVLKRTYTNSFYIIVIDKNTKISSSINQKILELKSRYPKLKEVLEIAETTEDAMEKVYYQASKIIEKQFMKES